MSEKVVEWSAVVSNLLVPVLFLCCFLSPVGFSARPSHGYVRRTTVPWSGVPFNYPS